MDLRFTIYDLRRFFPPTRICLNKFEKFSQKKRRRTVRCYGLIIDHAGSFEDGPAAFEGVDGGIDEAEVAEFGGDFIGGGAIGGAEDDDAFVPLGRFEHAAYGGIDLLLHGGAFADGEHAVLRQHEVVELKIALAAGIDPHHAVLVAGAEGLQADAPLGQLALHTRRQAARRKEDSICPAQNAGQEQDDDAEPDGLGERVFHGFTIGEF